MSFRNTSELQGPGAAGQALKNIEKNRPVLSTGISFYIRHENNLYKDDRGTN